MWALLWTWNYTRVISPWESTEIEYKNNFTCSVFSSQILQKAEMNIAYIGNFEENMDLSRIYLAVLCSFLVLFEVIETERSVLARKVQSGFFFFFWITFLIVFMRHWHFSARNNLKSRIVTPKPENASRCLRDKDFSLKKNIFIPKFPLFDNSLASFDLNDLQNLKSWHWKDLHHCTVAVLDFRIFTCCYCRKAGLGKREEYIGLNLFPKLRHSIF